MSPRGRPRSPVRSVRIVISGWLHPEYDADIIAWLEAIPHGQRMNAFKTALRNGGLGLALDAGISQTNEAQSDAEDILGNWEF